MVNTSVHIQERHHPVRALHRLPYTPVTPRIRLVQRCIHPFRVAQPTDPRHTVLSPPQVDDLSVNHRTPVPFQDGPL